MRTRVLIAIWILTAVAWAVTLMSVFYDTGYNHGHWDGMKSEQEKAIEAGVAHRYDSPGGCVFTYSCDADEPEPVTIPVWPKPVQVAGDD